MCLPEGFSMIQYQLRPRSRYQKFKFESETCVIKLVCYGGRSQLADKELPNCLRMCKNSGGTE